MSDDAALVADLLARTNRLAWRHARADLEPLGLTPATARLLRVLHRSDGTARMGELAERLGVVPRTATSTVDELEAIGAVERRPDPDDRRAVLVSLTDTGHDLLADLHRRHGRAIAAVLAPLSDDDRAHLVRILTLMTGR